MADDPTIAQKGPFQVALEKGKADVTATFGEPGDYVLQAVVDDGSGELAGNFGYHCCWSNVQVKVTVANGDSTAGGR